MRPGLLLALPLAASIGVAAACLIGLDPVANCGDGYVDALAGEDCEPQVPDSYASRCEELGQVASPAACAADSCTFDAEGCARCGNGVVDEGEQCDPAAPNPPSCPGEGEASCRSDCTLDLGGCIACGNGVVDIDEECDYAADNSGVEVDCTGLKSPGGVARRYGSGVSTQCTGKCEWDRSLCSYCQNDLLEGAGVTDVYVDFENTIKPPPEVCDNGHADHDKLVEFCQQTEICGGNYRVECAAECDSTCRFAAPPDDAELDCCTAQGADCPYDKLTGELRTGRVDCCRRFTHPDEPTEKLCQDAFDPGDPDNFISLCR